ncbi:MAG: alpha-L-rhamnosidase [Chthoniobacteraceae bacterium]
MQKPVDIPLLPPKLHPARAQRVLISEPPSFEKGGAAPWLRGTWPCRWVGCAEATVPPYVVAYRNRFAVETPLSVLLHVTADERYELFLDGERIGRGSERGDAGHWFFETYDLSLPAGSHTLVARVWALGELAPMAQISLTPGFYAMPADRCFLPLLGTGHAAWEAKVLHGYSFHSPLSAWGTGARADLDGRFFDWGFERGEGEGWQPCVLLHEGFSGAEKNDASTGHHRLFPATLPPMMEVHRCLGTVRHLSSPPSARTWTFPIRSHDHLSSEAAPWQRLFEGGAALTLEANTRRRVIVDLGNYYCVYPELVLSRGESASVRLFWQESLYLEPEAVQKGNRNEIEGKYFTTPQGTQGGLGETFVADGGLNRKFETLWWECGRYVEILVETGAEPLVIESIGWRETRYPLEMESLISTGDARLDRLVAPSLRTLQMCAHETYMDCPFYEQLMYAGDARLQILSTYVITPDDRLPRKALRLLDWSRGSSGTTLSRAPSRVGQTIPPFSLWWVGMVHDFALWRGDSSYVRQLLPGVRAVADFFRGQVTEEGLVTAPWGWNFQDWVGGDPAPTGWSYGVPPDGERGISGVLCWQAALAFRQAADLETYAGDPELASLHASLSARIAAASFKAFWNEELGLLADDRAQRHFSEHSQALAALCLQFSDSCRQRLAQGLAHSPDLVRTTIYFSHYLFDAYRQLGLGEAFFQRLGFWFALEPLGIKTLLERPEPSRSDCHAWSAHPLYHLYATILGVRPAAMGFSEVLIAPMLGELKDIKGQLHTPKGIVRVHLQRETQALNGSIELPPGLGGRFVFGETTLPLHGGKQSIQVVV